MDHRSRWQGSWQAEACWSSHDLLGTATLVARHGGTTIEPYLVVDLNEQFIELCLAEGINAYCGDILKLGGVLVSPANSYGFMDGGLDWLISQMYPSVQATVQNTIQMKWGGVLPVGAAFACPTAENHPFVRLLHDTLIVAPTMHTPATNLNGTLNAYLATKAAKWQYDQMSWMVKQSSPLLIPGMGTGSGGLNLKIAARQMAAALKESPRFNSWRDAKMYELWLTRLDSTKPGE